MPMTNDGEGQPTFDSNAESDLQRSLHQAKLSRDRWKFWSGNVPENINRRIEELETILLMKKCQLVDEKKEEEDEEEEVDEEKEVIDEPKPIVSALIHGPQIDRYVEQTMKIVLTPMKKNKSKKRLFCCHQ